MEFRFVTRNPNVYAKTEEAGLKMVAKYPESRTDEFVYLCRSKGRGEERRKEKERGEKKEEKVATPRSKSAAN